MTRLRRTTWTPLERPTPGELHQDDAGNLSVPISIGPDEQLDITDPAWSRDLAAAAAVATSVLEAAHGLPAPSAPSCSCDADPLQCAHQSRLGQVEDDRDAFRALLVRAVSARTVPEYQAVMDEARLALARYDRRGPDLMPTQKAEQS